TYQTTKDTSPRSDLHGFYAAAVELHRQATGAGRHGRGSAARPTEPAARPSPSSTRPRWGAGGGRGAGQGPAKLARGADVQLRDHLAQVVLDRARAKWSSLDVRACMATVRGG